MVTGLIETVDGVMGHIASNLHAGAPQVAIAGSSSVAGTGQVGGVDGRGAASLGTAPRSARLRVTCTNPRGVPAPRARVPRSAASRAVTLRGRRGAVMAGSWDHV